LSSIAPVPQEYPVPLSASPCWCRSPLPLLSTSSLDTAEANHHSHIFVVLCWCFVWVITPTQIHTLTHTAQPPQPGCPPASMSVANAGCHNTVLSLPLGRVIPVLLHMQAAQLLLQNTVFMILGNVLPHPAIAAWPLLVFMLCHSCNATMHYANGRLPITCCAAVVFC